MSRLISLGAINKKTNEYCYPKIANKQEKYVCPDCNKDVMLVKGEILRPHFRHKTSKDPCKYYNNPGESQIHKDAKLLLKNLLEKEIPIRFYQNCLSCKRYKTFTLPKQTEKSTIVLEHRFVYNGNTKIADVAHICGDNILAIYEICHTHKTLNEDRPEPWVEIDAKSLLLSVNTSSEELIIQCKRQITCRYCDCMCCNGTGLFPKDLNPCIWCCCGICGANIDKCKCICNKCGERLDECECICNKCGERLDKCECRKTYTGGGFKSKTLISDYDSDTDSIIVINDCSYICHICKEKFEETNLFKNKGGLYECNKCICPACQGSGIAYMTDGIYGPCIFCCCIDCGAYTLHGCEECKCSDSDSVCDTCGGSGWFEQNEICLDCNLK
jgi:hypothetical protein